MNTPKPEFKHRFIIVDWSRQDEEGYPFAQMPSENGPCAEAVAWDILEDYFEQLVACDWDEIALGIYNEYHRNGDAPFIEAAKATRSEAELNAARVIAAMADQRFDDAEKGDAFVANYFNIPPITDEPEAERECPWIED